MRTSEYTLLVANGEHMLLSPVCLKILQTVEKHSSTYADIAEQTGIPQQSLYVFCQRLETAGLLKREAFKCEIAKRIKTRLSAALDFKILKVQVLH